MPTPIFLVFVLQILHKTSVQVTGDVAIVQESKSKFS